ncbi:hypothetical protein [Microbispora catharanthi]|uniref:hypothetical protein n=1 Tax=Microbispora catharanthi TaxID=1712871 RepID=UPI00142EFFD1|nr:hypothetical protein [Microbispora catharanthi]
MLHRLSGSLHRLSGLLHRLSRLVHRLLGLPRLLLPGLPHRLLLPAGLRNGLVLRAGSGVATHEVQ